MRSGPSSKPRRKNQLNNADSLNANGMLMRRDVDVVVVCSSSSSNIDNSDNLSGSRRGNHKLDELHLFGSVRHLLVVM